ncbi:MAG: hypothetical protein GF388_00690 [Candidatus Aegiribacteria sp.]|nr:hypothetical protein [Candidatus Aegiribacteria sp.]MBD3293945.1 hypothetical protein [Candidatus Fermentibacteria bacterium]
MSLLLAAILAFTYSPQDSCWSMVTLDNVPDRAVLFSQLAAREGGKAAVDFASMLELSGRFGEAGRVYGIVLNSSSDSLLSGWIENRMMGVLALDTMIIISASIANTSEEELADVTLEMPLPRSHEPYQQLEIVAGAFRERDNVLHSCIPLLPAGTSVVLPLVLHIRQRPHSFRPLPKRFEGSRGPVSLEEIARMLRSISVPESENGPGPCLEVAMRAESLGSLMGLDLTVTGGLLRSGGNLDFHAWNTVSGTGIPLDAVMFQSDSMRGIGHCPTDFIPLWNLEDTEGHELSVYYPGSELQVSIQISVSYANAELINGLMNVFPLSLLKQISGG